MREEFLGERKRALEEEFFKRRETAALEQLRAELGKRAARAALAEVSGVTDEALLDRLLDLGISAGTAAPLSLVPLVEVAWADGKVDPAEKAAILSAAKDAGLAETSAGYSLLESWLDERPALQLRDLWIDYTRRVCGALRAVDRDALKAQLLGRARQVAKAAGGFLGLGSKVSKTEEAVLQELARAFSD